MSEKISSNKRGALKSIISIGSKTMNWALVFSLVDLVLKGKCLPGNLWQVMIPLAIVAGGIWWWATSQLPEK